MRGRKRGSPFGNGKRCFGTQKELALTFAGLRYGKVRLVSNYQIWRVVCIMVLDGHGGLTNENHC